MAKTLDRRTDKEWFQSCLNCCINVNLSEKIHLGSVISRERTRTLTGQSSFALHHKIFL